MNSVSDTSNPLKRVALVGTCLDSGGLLNAKTPGRKDAKDIRESAAHSRVVQPVNSFCHELTRLERSHPTPTCFSRFRCIRP